MRAVTSPAWRADNDFVPLIEVLLAVGPWTFGQVSWAVGGSEFGTGWRGSAELARKARDGRRVSTRVLVDLVSDGLQLWMEKSRASETPARTRFSCWRPYAAIHGTFAPQIQASWRLLDAASTTWTS